MWLDRFRPRKQPAGVAELQIDCKTRATRFELDSQISFAEDDRHYDGKCIDVSESGLLARFEASAVPDLWTEGQLSLEAGEHFLDINARVARYQQDNVAFAFSSSTENDQAAIKILLNSVLGRPVTNDEADV